MKKFCPVSIRLNPSERPPPVVVFIVTFSVMYIMAPDSALKTWWGSRLIVTIWDSLPSILLWTSKSIGNPTTPSLLVAVVSGRLLLLLLLLVLLLLPVGVFSGSDEEKRRQARKDLPCIGAGNGTGRSTGSPATVRTCRREILERIPVAMVLLVLIPRIILYRLSLCFTTVIYPARNGRLWLWCLACGVQCRLGRDGWFYPIAGLWVASEIR
mmetsp:Transcript_22750/g.48317  ORF Transcript_22750/g.48317 Transcript_22750/m.48317 type:complete len:212 (+) Transcript_22750:2380-3015(+)